MEKKILKNKVKTAIINRMVSDNPFASEFKNALLPIPLKERFDIREYEEGKEKTAVTAYGKDDGEYGIFTKTNFIPLDELSYRELEKTLNVIHE